MNVAQNFNLLHVKIHAGDDCNLFGCHEQKYPTQNFFQLLPRFPLTCAKNPVYYYCCAGVAQLVEQLIRNQQVAGSSPASSSSGRLPHPRSQFTLVGCDFYIARNGASKRDTLP